MEAQEKSLADCPWVSPVLCLVAQSCPTLCDPMDCSWPGSSVHGDSPGKNTGVGCYALIQGIFPTQGLNPGLPHCRQILYHLSHQGSWSPEWALSGSFPSLSFEDLTHLFWRSMDLDTHSKLQTYGTPSGDWYPEPSICMAWKLEFLWWEMGRWGGICSDHLEDFNHGHSTARSSSRVKT